MATTGIFTLRKEERICSKKLIAELFDTSKNISLAAFPLRVIASIADRQTADAGIKMMVSVPKRHLHHAVDRNRAKRQVREAYRKHKELLCNTMADKPGKQLLVAFLWTDGKLHSSQTVEAKVQNLLRRIAEKL